MMNTRSSLPAFLVLSLSLALSPACKKNGGTENPDGATGGEVSDGGTGEGEAAESGGEAEAAAPALPEQDPDPAEIESLYTRYLQGDYEAVANEAEEMRAGMTGDTQVRAHALLSSIAALAEAETVPEKAQASSEQAVADGERLEDPQVRQLGHIAHAIYLVRVHEGPAGQVELEEALKLGGPYESLNYLMLAEAHLNQAFGTGDEDMKIKDPARLDEARSMYEAALAKGNELLQAHAHEGLAGVAKYKREDAKVCEHAQAAEDLYAAGAATDYIREVPALLAKGAKCKDFKKAE